MSKYEIENERLYDIVNTVGDILQVNDQNQECQELKILTPNQMLSRLPITLAQLKQGIKAGKVSKKLLYSLHPSKKLTKTIYNNLVNSF